MASIKISKIKEINEGLEEGVRIMKDLILNRIERLEKDNQDSRIFCALLDENNKLDSKLKEYEFVERTIRIYAIMILKGILEELEEGVN